jgi:hypothetical protein
MEAGGAGIGSGAAWAGWARAAFGSAGCGPGANGAGGVVVVTIGGAAAGGAAGGVASAICVGGGAGARVRNQPALAAITTTPAAMPANNGSFDPAGAATGCGGAATGFAAVAAGPRVAAGSLRAARNASANAAAVANRSAGRFAIAWRTTASTPGGTAAASCEGFGGSVFSTLCMMPGSPPSNGRAPVSNWYSTTPAA